MNLSFTRWSSAISELFRAKRINSLPLCLSAYLARREKRYVYSLENCYKRYKSCTIKYSNTAYILVWNLHEVQE